MTIGHRGQDEQAGLVAPPPEDQPQLGAQEPGRRPRPRVAAAGRRSPRPPQPLTSKPSPVSATNRSSRLGRRRPRSPHARRRRAPAPRRPSPARPRRACRCTSPPAVSHLLGHARARPARRAAASGWSVATRDPGRGLRRAAPRSVPWATSRPTCITPTWVQICSTSASRWLETQHRGAVGGQRPDQRAHLAGALRVEAVGRLVEDQQLARRSRAAAMASRCRMPRE